MQAKKNSWPDASKEKLQALCKQKNNPGLLESVNNAGPDASKEKLQTWCKQRKTLGIMEA